MPLAFRCVLMFGISKSVRRFSCLVPCVLLLGAFSCCLSAFAAPTAEQSAIIAEQTKVIEANPKDWDALYKRARAYQKSGNLQAAKRDCIAVSLLNQSCQKNWILLMLVTYHLKEYEESVVASRKAQITGPSHQTFGGMEAACLRLLGRNEECLVRCDDLLKSYPNFAELYFLRGSARAALHGDRSKILQDLRSAMKLDPGNKRYESELMERLKVP